jgi:hypothetical protein
MTNINKLAEVIKDFNESIDALFDDPNWKANHSQHFAAISKVQDRSKNLLDCFNLSTDSGGRYKKGRKEFAQKHSETLHKLWALPYKGRRKHPDIKTLALAAREELKYSTGTSDNDIVTLLYRALMK